MYKYKYKSPYKYKYKYRSILSLEVRDTIVERDNNC